MSDASSPQMSIEGHCPICETACQLVAYSPDFRNTLICKSCVGLSLPRDRALMAMLAETRPRWRKLALLEISPGKRAMSSKLGAECEAYLASHYFPGEPLGAIVEGYRNEDMERLTFPDASFDVVLSNDVLEHVFDPAAAMREAARVLKPGGVFIATFPIHKSQVNAANWRARQHPDGSAEHLSTAQYHGNPISEEGSLVTVDYGYDVHTLISDWAPFDVRITRFADRTIGVLGEYTEVVVCRKRLAPNQLPLRKRVLELLVRRPATALMLVLKKIRAIFRR